MLSALAYVAALLEEYFDVGSINECYAFGESHAGRSQEAIGSLLIPCKVVIVLQATRIFNFERSNINLDE